MATKDKVCAWGSIWSVYRRHLTVIFFLVLALGVFTRTARADNWTGAGQAVANQTRDWRIPLNWQFGGPPPIPPWPVQNSFSYLGEGTIELNGLQSSGAITFNDFTYTTIARGALPPPSNLTMVDLVGGATSIQMGEGVRDTYGSDYFTAGPQFTADVNMNILNPINPTLNVNLGSAAGNGSNSSMMFSGQINNLNNNSFFYSGTGAGTSLWISSNNIFGGMNPNNIITINSAGAGADGYALHLVDNGRMNFTPIDLQGTSSYLGLQDNTGGGVGGVQLPGNTYNNWVWSHGGIVFTDRSYQALGQDSNTTVNVLQYLTGGVTDYNGMINFGSTGPTSHFGRTNNGFSLRLGVFDWENNVVPKELVHVNNGNLTLGRGGSRYMSGANRLQEAHNYVYVDMLNELSPNQVNLIPLGKGGTGVLAIDLVNGGVQGGLQQWKSAPQVLAGVLRLGSGIIPALPGYSHAMPIGQSLTLTTPDAGVGIGWNTNVNLFAAVPAPFAITPAGWIPGQCGAVDIDMWNHGLGGALSIDTNFGVVGLNLTYLRVGSSMGGDATFDPQPNPIKHASTSAFIFPYRGGMAPPTYFLGGGGGTLEIDSILSDYMGAGLEMGTTGTLLPGRVALNPQQGINQNQYPGPTNVRAGTLQLMQQGSVFASALVSTGTYDTQITNGLYAQPIAPYTWTGPGQLLLDPGRNGILNDWSLGWYLAAGGLPLWTPANSFLSLDGGVVGWTGNVTVQNVPGTYGAQFIVSNLVNPLGQNVKVLGLGGEYSAGTMTTTFNIADTPQGAPVLLYKAGMNSKLDLTLGPLVNTFTGGTIIAGGELVINDTRELNAHPAGNGGPIAILNGGRLHFTAGGNAKTFGKAIKINTSGTPDPVKNCGSVIEVDPGVTLALNANFDFSWAPTTYLEKDGDGTLNYNAPAPVAGAPGGNPANAWGLKLTGGLVKVNQLPVNPSADSGPVIFNNGNLEVASVPVGMTLDTDPAYGFRNMVSFQTTSSTVTVDDNAMFRTHGIVPSEILGTVNFVGGVDASSANNIVHLSRNMAPAVLPAPGDYSRGDGTMTFTGVTVYMSGGGQGNLLNVLPQEAGFILQLNDGVVFNASHQNNVCGEVNFNNLTPANPVKWVKINGGEAIPATPLAGGPPYNFTLASDTWTIYGTGYTTWAGTTEKVGSGTVAIKRSTGAPVAINANTLLKISAGTFEAGGTADPFTDTLSGLSLDIQNDSTVSGLLISQGVKNVDRLTGVGNTTVNGAGTQLIASCIQQNTLTVAAGCIVTIRPAAGGPLASTQMTAVPEPSSIVLLTIAALGLMLAPWRRK